MAGAPRNPFDLDERDSNLERRFARNVVRLITSYLSSLRRPNVIASAASRGDMHGKL